MGRVPENSVINGVITVWEAAALIEVGQTMISRLVASGHIVPVARGQYTPRNVVSGYLRFQREAAAAHSLASHRGAMADARARLLELQIAEEEPRLMDVTEAMDLIERGCRGGVAVLTMLPGRIAPDDHEERVRITGIIDVAREELAAAFESCAAEIRTVVVG